MVGFSPKFFRCDVGNSGHNSSTVMIYSSFGEDQGITVKLGPLAKHKICASLTGLKDKLLTHLAVMLSGAGIPGLQDVVAVVGVAAVELLEVADIVEVLEFEQSSEFAYMYLPKLPPLTWLLLMFEQPTVFLCYNLLNFTF